MATKKLSSSEIKKKKCSYPDPPDEGLPIWMGTFADLMSLLMCFFVLLLAFSEMDVLKFKQIAGSMKFAFGVQNKIEVKNIIEKPNTKDAPSNVAVVGRYIVEPSVFDHLGLQKKGSNGEVQLTDSLSYQIGKAPFFGYNFHGTRYDCGTKFGFAKANASLAIKDANIGNQFKDWITKLNIS